MSDGTIQKASDFEFETGLEDFSMEDAVIPRLKIVHKEGEFEDSLSGERFGSIKIIILGLVKQRVLWHTTLDDGDWPMCRSTDHDTGFPNMADEQPRDKRFPWKDSGFDKADFPPDDEGIIRLPCKGCQLKEWGSHPDGKRPYCSEQFTLPIMYDPTGDEDWVPAIITFQKTGLKPLKAYLSSFARSRNAAFTAVTEVSLDMLRRGQTDYSVPKFRKAGNTDSDNWREYSESYRTMKNFLEAEPGSREQSEDEDEPKSKAKSQPDEDNENENDDNTVDAEIVEEKEEPKAESKQEDDDDLPF